MLASVMWDEHSYSNRLSRIIRPPWTVSADVTTEIVRIDRLQSQYVCRGNELRFDKTESSGFIDGSPIMRENPAASGLTDRLLIVRPRRLMKRLDETSNKGK